MKTNDPRTFASPELCRLAANCAAAVRPSEPGRNARHGQGFIALIARVWLAHGEPRPNLDHVAASRGLKPASLRAMVQRELRFRKDARRWARRGMSEAAAEEWLQNGPRTRVERTAYVRAAGLSRGEFVCAIARVELARRWGWSLSKLDSGDHTTWR